MYPTQVTMTRLEGLASTPTLSPHPTHLAGEGAGVEEHESSVCSGQRQQESEAEAGKEAVWRRCPAVHFPYAILEVKLQDEDSCPPWLQV